MKENIGDEFAREVERICRFEYNNIEKLKDKIYKLESEVEDMEVKTNDYDDISQSLDYLNGQLDKLENYIVNNDDGTDFMEGMRKAYKMVER